MIAFGGGGPVHACRVAEKIGIARVLVPSGAGVGSAIGFLRAPVGYEVVRSLYQRFSTFDVAAVNALLEEMAARGRRRGERRQLRRAHHAKSRLAYMRYVGQGHEIPVPLPARLLTAEDIPALRGRYDGEYTRFYDRPVPGSDVEIMSYAVNGERPFPTRPRRPRPIGVGSRSDPGEGPRHQSVRDTLTGEVAEWAVHDRPSLRPGDARARPRHHRRRRNFHAGRPRLVGAAQRVRLYRTDTSGWMTSCRRKPPRSRKSSGRSCGTA